MTESRDRLPISGEVTVRVWDAENVKEAIPEWDELPEEQKLQMLREEPPVEPKHEGTASNMILDNYLVELASGANPTPSHMAFGDSTLDVQPGDDSLGNEVYRTIVGQDESDGFDRLLSTLLGQDEAVGLAIREVGLTTGQMSNAWTLLTHVVLPTSEQIDEKSSGEIATYDYVLQFRRPA